MTMDINIHDIFRVVIPASSTPAKIYVEDIKIAGNGHRLIHYSYYNYHSKQWITYIDDEIDFLHMLAVRPRRKRKRRNKKEDIRENKRRRMGMM